jgi:hypothetical protein
MRAFLLVAAAALLVLPSTAAAQRASRSGATADAPRSRVGDAPRSREGGAQAPRPTPPVGTGATRPTAGEPGTWGGQAPAVGGRPSVPYRSAPYRSSPYGSPGQRPPPRHPATPYSPYAPYSPYYPYGYHPYGYAPYGYGVSVRVPTVVVVTPYVAGTVPVEPAVAAPAEPTGPRGKLLVVGGGGEAPLLNVEAAGDTLLRLRWTGRGSDVREVTLLLLDAERVLLVAQTVHEAPYTALFDRPARAAFAGVSVTYAGGASMTTVVPLSPDGGTRD